MKILVTRKNMSKPPRGLRMLLQDCAGASRSNPAVQASKNENPTRSLSAKGFSFLNFIPKKPKNCVAVFLDILSINWYTKKKK